MLINECLITKLYVAREFCYIFFQSIMDIDAETKPAEDDSFKVPLLPSFAKPASVNNESESVTEVKEKSDQDDQTVPEVDTVAIETSNEVGTESEKIQQPPSSPVTAPPFQYQEPSWGGVSNKPYSLEILKNGTIVDTFKLEGKSHFTVGRLPICDVPFEHPSLSRYHAILQFKTTPSPEKPVGFYLFDLDSTHGTQHNKRKCFPRTFYRLRVGHMLRFGGSTRTAILQGPDEDQEEESDLSVTELKALAAEKAQKKAEEEERLKRLAEEAENEKEEREASRGISWGMDDEPEDQFPDMEKNPFAELANNESLYIDDPKKCLQNWFNREGYDLEYKVEEKGFSQFSCRIELPVDGQPNFAEAEVKGKKKECVVQAALEACRILDRLGLLKQSQQTRMERKVKKWEDDDFYDSDEDEFLDRTGEIEQKRKKRMKMAGVAADTVETYDSLTKKFEELKKEQKDTEEKLNDLLRQKAKLDQAASEDNDLDKYMKNLKKGDTINKEAVTRLKVRLQQLSTERERLVKLINITRPTNMPELKTDPSTAAKPKSSIMIGKMGSRGYIGKVKSVAKSSVAKPIVVPSERTMVLEAFLQEDEEKSKRLKLSADSDDHELKPIGYEVHKPVERAKKERIGDTSVNVKKVLIIIRELF